MRHKKVVNGNVTDYYYSGAKLLAEYRKNTFELLSYFYDQSGIAGMIYKGEYYYFDKNTLGDVIAIRDEQGAVVGEYYYDAWGNIIYQSGSMASKNPFRYRGYYYDSETGFYYLQTRYYDPEIGRFINADNYELVGTLASVPGQLNMYAYCNNNPVMYTDPTGYMPEWVKWALGGIAILGFAVATIATLGAFGAVGAPIGAAVLSGGIISGGINAIDQLSDGGTFDWGELAIATLSGQAYGLVVGLTGGTGGLAVAGKFAVAGGTSLLNSWNKNATFGETMMAVGLSLVLSGSAQGTGYFVGKFGPQIVSGIIPRNPNHLITMGDIVSVLWSSPMIKTGAIRFFGGISTSIFNNVF